MGSVNSLNPHPRPGPPEFRGSRLPNMTLMTKFQKIGDILCWWSLRALLNSSGTSVEAASTPSGYTALHLACLGGHIGVVGLLLSRSTALLKVYWYTIHMTYVHKLQNLNTYFFGGPGVGGCYRMISKWHLNIVLGILIIFIRSNRQDIKRKKMKINLKFEFWLDFLICTQINRNFPYPQ